MNKDKGVVKRVFVTPDKHFPLHDKKAINVVKKAIEIVKPDVYVDLGDVGEWHGCSHWQWKKKKRPPLEYQLPFIDKDIKDVNKGMDMIDESLDKANCTEKYMIEGNHDDWMNRFVDENPYLMYGHHHDIQQSSMTHMDGQKSAWSIGCLKDMRNEQNTWLGGRPINWSHAFAIVDFFTKGHFTVHVIQIIDGRTSLWGELING